MRQTKKEELDAGIRAAAEEIRREAAKDGFDLTDEEYEEILQYTARKARINKKDDDYIPILLEDEIRDYFFRNAINAITLTRAALA